MSQGQSTIEVIAPRGYKSLRTQYTVNKTMHHEEYLNVPEIQELRNDL